MDPMISIRSLCRGQPLAYWTVIAAGSAPTFLGAGLGEIVEGALQQEEVRDEANVQKKESCFIAVKYLRIASYNDEREVASLLLSRFSP